MEGHEAATYEFLRHINSAIRGLTLYPAGHPSVSRSVTEAYKAAAFLLTAKGKFVVGLVEDLLVADGTPIYAVEPYHELLSRMRGLNIGTITVSRGVSEREIGGGLLRLLHSEAADIKAQGGFVQLLSRLGVSHITVSGPRVEEEEDSSDIARKVYTNAVSAVKEAMEEVRLGRIPSSSAVKTVVGEMVNQVLENRGAIMGLSMIKSYDDYTFHHCVNVTILSLVLADAVGMPKDVLDDLGIGAALHDIGKIETYETIIKKPGPLSDEEWKEVRKHPSKGAEILHRMGINSDVSISVVLEHHLKYNGHGYPDIEGLTTQSEPAMCASIADCYDALTTLRPYRVPSNPAQALDMMKEKAGTDFEPNLLGRFVEVLGIYPPGTLVRLNTNEIAIVKSPNVKDPLQPQVRLIYDRLGRKIEGGKEFFLAEVDEKGWRRTVVSVVDPVAKNIDTSALMW